MASSAAKSVQVQLEHFSGGLGWTIARLPFDPHAAWKKMVRLRVQVEIAGQVFRTSLFPDAVQGGYFVLVNKKMQKVAGIGPTGTVAFTITPDLQERLPSYPPELAKLLKKEKALTQWMANLSDSNRSKIGNWVDGVKSPEARQRRAEQMAERLMLTMHGESELPPILELAFRNTPAARKGWDAMTAAQRRNQLLGVFYYQNPEARIRRVEKLVAEALNHSVAKK